MATAQARFDETLSRIDSVLDAQVARLERVEAQQAAEREEARRARMRDAMHERTEIASRYDRRLQVVRHRGACAGRRRSAVTISRPAVQSLGASLVARSRPCIRSRRRSWRVSLSCSTISRR